MRYVSSEWRTGLDTYHDANKRVVPDVDFYCRDATCGVCAPYNTANGSLSPHDSDSSSIGSPSSFHASIPPTTSVAFKSPMSCSDAAANELV